MRQWYNIIDIIPLRIWFLRLSQRSRRFIPRGDNQQHKDRKEMRHEKKNLIKGGAAGLLTLLLTAAMGCFASFTYDSASLKTCTVENRNTVVITGTAEKDVPQETVPRDLRGRDRGASGDGGSLTTAIIICLSCSPMKQGSDPGRTMRPGAIKRKS